MSLTVVLAYVSRNLKINFHRRINSLIKYIDKYD